MTNAYEWALPGMREILRTTVRAASADERIIGLLAAGSAATGTMDEFSDLDLVVVCRDADHADVLTAGPEFAARLGPLVASFTGEHVGEPRLLINLYGPPLQHVDLKFVSDRQLDDRVENGLVVWQRGDAVTAALARAEAVWPAPDPQWIEDRFWTWLHYGAAKAGRGELFECLDVLGALRGAVLGPLIALDRGYRPSGARRLETIAPDLVPDLTETVATVDPADCLRALRATADLYVRLRENHPDLRRHAEAETAAVQYVAEIEARVASRFV